MPSTTVSTSVASSGLAGACVVIIVFAIEKIGRTTVPAEVSAAGMVVMATIFHLIASRFGIDPAELQTPRPRAVVAEPKPVIPVITAAGEPPHA